MSESWGASTRVEGYEAPIKRALWERIQTGGAPRLWSAVWAVLCLYIGLICLYTVGFRAVLLPAGVWLLGQGVLMALTAWDSQWDDVALDQVKRRYQAYYDAG